MFSGIPQFEPCPGRKGHFVVTQPWWYMHPAFGKTELPAGFVTDFASTPQILHAIPLFDPLEEGIYGSLPHDFEYTLQRRPRADCDEILLAALIESGMSSPLAMTYYLGVRSGGWLPWGRQARAGGISPADFIDRASFRAWRSSYLAVNAQESPSA